MEIRFGKFLYTGRHGAGVIPEFDATRVKHVIQGLLIDPHDPDAAPNADTLSFKPPIAFERRPKRKIRSPVLDGLFPEEPLIAAPVPDVREIPEPDKRPLLKKVLLHNGEAIPVPEDLKTLLEENGLRFVREDALFYDPEQARGLTIATKTDGNICFVAETGFGKTILQLLLIDWVLSQTKRAVILVPFDNLVEQFQRDARLFFDFPEDLLVFASGQSHTPEKRRELYQSSTPFCLVTTPEAFLHDLDKGRIDARVFDFRFYDEIHLARGDYAHVQVEKAFNNELGRVFGFTGTFPTDKKVRGDIVKTFGFSMNGVQTVHRLHPEPSSKFVKTIFSRPDAEMLKAAEQLYTAAGRAAYHTAAVLHAAFRTETGVIVDEYILRQFRKLTKLEKGGFAIPPHKDFTRIRQRLMKLCESDQKRFWRSYSWFCEFEHLCYLYMVLVCFGKFAFLMTLADNLWAIHLPGARPRVKKSKKYRLETKKFIKRACANPLVRDAYKSLSSGSVFDLLLSPSVSLFRIWNELPAESKSGYQKYPDPTKFYKLYCDSATEQFVTRDYLDHPNELRCFDLIRRHATFGYRDQILVYSNLGKHAPFLARRIQHKLADVVGRTASFVGRKHTTIAKRRGVIAAFQQRDIHILVGTKAIATGLDSNATVLISWTQDARWEDRSQAEGRVGRKGKPGLNYNLIVPGTQESIRYYRGIKNLRNARSSNARLGE